MHCGGSEKYTLTLVQHLSATGIDCVVASAGGDLVSALPTNVPHIHCPLNSKNPMRILINAWRLRKIIKEHQITLVHVHSRAPAFSVCCLNIPWVSTCHSRYGLKPYLLKWCYNRVLFCGDRVLVLSRTIQEYIDQHYPAVSAKTALTPGGIDLDFFSREHFYQIDRPEIKRSLSIPEHHFIILMVARVNKNKGIYVLLEALSHLPLAHQHNVSTIIVGPIDKMLHQQLRQLPLQVHYTGAVSDPRRYYSIADVTVVPSIVAEGLGLTTLESLAMEVPVIASNSGASTDIITSQVGRLFTPGDAQQLLKALITLIEKTAEQRQRMGARGRTRVRKHFNLDTLLKTTVDCYHEVSSNH